MDTSNAYPILFDMAEVQIEYLDSLKNIDPTRMLLLTERLYGRQFTIKEFAWYDDLNGKSHWAIAQHRKTGEYIGSYGLLPYSLVLNQQHVQGYLAHTVGVVQEYQGTGLFQYIMENALDNFVDKGEIAIAFPNRKSLMAHKRAGWKEIGKMGVYIKKKFRHTEETAFDDIKQVDMFTEEINALTQRRLEETDFTIAKDYKHLNWRSTKPHCDYIRYIQVSGGCVVGYMVFKLYNDARHGKLSGDIVDIYALNKKAYSLLIQKAESVCQANKADQLSIWAYEKSRCSMDLEKEGFNKGTMDYDYSLIVYDRDNRTEILQHHAFDVSLSYGDNDVF